MNDQQTNSQALDHTFQKGFREGKNPLVLWFYLFVESKFLRAAERKETESHDKHGIESRNVSHSFPTRFFPRILNVTLASISYIHFLSPCSVPWERYSVSKERKNNFLPFLSLSRVTLFPFWFQWFEWPKMSFYCLLQTVGNTFMIAICKLLTLSYLDTPLDTYQKPWLHRHKGEIVDP